VTPIQHDAVGICPAILLPEPMRTDDETFERVVHAAAAAGFTSFSLWSFWATSYGTERARALLDSVGIRVPAVEAVMQWANGPSNALDAEMTAMTEAASGLGAEMLVACTLEPTVASLDDAVTGFRAACDQAAAHDLRICIEFFPWSGMPDLATAWQVVQASDAPNGGILIDMMHWQHQDGGPNFALLERIPGERIHYVQVCDAVPPRAPAGDYMIEALANRRLPGNGVVDIARLLGTLEGIGADPWFAYEVFNHDLAAGGPEAMAQTLRAISFVDREN
jgi:sugar phosphate isomerase/epimerase